MKRIEITISVFALVVAITSASFSLYTYFQQQNIMYLEKIENIGKDYVGMMLNEHFIQINTKIVDIRAKHPNWSELEQTFEDDPQADNSCSGAGNLINNYRRLYFERLSDLVKLYNSSRRKDEIKKIHMFSEELGMYTVTLIQAAEDVETNLSLYDNCLKKAQSRKR